MSNGLTRAQSIGRQVRAALAEQGRGQHDIAQLLGLAYAAVSRRVHGHVSFRADELMQIGEYLDVDPARFFRPVPEPRIREDPDTRVDAARGAA